jgi:CarboxypepD_reg-like domain
MKTGCTAVILLRSACLGFLLLVLTAAQARSSSLTGQVLDEGTQAPVAFASIGVLHRPAGTVANEQGRFTLDLLAATDQDSVRVGLLGYASLTLPVATLRQELARNQGRIYLRLAPVKLADVVVRPGKVTYKVIGNSGNSSTVQGGFGVNRLGNQLAQAMHLRRPGILEQVSFHVAKCTYDSLFYRVNVYRLEQGVPVASLLPEPVYVRVRKGQTKDRFVVDLRRYQLSVEGDIAVGLEMVKDLGPGTLMLSLSVLGGPVYVTDQATNGWERVRGFGVGIDATVAEYR